MPSLEKPTLALLQEKLNRTDLSSDPTAVVMPAGSENWPQDFRDDLTRSLRPAGVLIPVIERKGGLVVLLTQRSAALKHHAGQVSFPGGRMEAGDSDIVATALRETHEEVGIAPEDITVLGYLDAMPTITGFAVTPIVGSVAAGAKIVVDKSEVEFAFEVPLSYLLNRGNARSSERDFNGRKLPIVEFQFERHRIWGATAHMLLELRKILIKH